MKKEAGSLQFQILCPSQQNALSQDVADISLRLRFGHFQNELETLIQQGVAKESTFVMATMSKEGAIHLSLSTSLEYWLFTSLAL